MTSEKQRLKVNNWIIRQSSQCERFVKEWFSVLGKVDKIPTSTVPTYDFKVDNQKLLIEVKYISTEKRFHKVTHDVDEVPLHVEVHLGEELTDDDFYSKIQTKVMATQKEYSKYPDYYRGGIIFWDDLFDFLQYPPTHCNYDEIFPYDYDIFDYDWDYLVLHEMPTVGEWPLVFSYVKKHNLVDPLVEVFKKHRHTMYVLIEGKFHKYNKAHIDQLN